ncbi:hypothetical protein KC352_g32572, partial [Hortaea werneckii]
MPTNPTVLLVHGAFHVPQHFEHLASLLKQAGYRVEVPALPSVGIEQDPGNALELDAGFLCDKLEELVRGEEERDVVVLMHSYGGQCGSEAIAKFLDRQSSQSHPQPIPPSTSPHTVRRRRYGSIIRLICLNAPLLSP